MFWVQGFCEGLEQLGADWVLRGLGVRGEVVYEVVDVYALEVALFLIVLA